VAKETARLLEQLGHVVDGDGPGALDDAEGMAGYFPIFAAAIARDLDRWSAATGDPIGPDDVEPWNWGIAEVGRAVSGPAYLAAIEALQAASRRLAAWWKYHDVLVTPTLGITPPRLGTISPDRSTDEVLPVVSRLTQFLTPFNMTGQPAISLPLGMTDDGLPVGVQLVGAFGREDVLLRVAAQLEQARPWSGRRPPVHA
jgi:amidase